MITQKSSEVDTDLNKIGMDRVAKEEKQTEN